jgi:hypothetical protein
MNKKLITEIGKIQRIIYNKEIITEAMAPAFLKRVFSLADDVVKSFMKTDLTDDIINSIRKGEQLSDEAVDRLLKNIDFNKLSATIINNKMLGTAFDEQVDKVIELIRKNPKQQEIILQKLDDSIDNIAFLSEGPEQLKNAIKKRTRAKVTESLVEGIDDVFSAIDDYVNLLDEYGQKVSDNIADNTPGLPPDLKKQTERYWDTFWTKKETYAEMLKRRAPYAKSIRVGKGETEKILPGGADIGGRSIDDIQKILDRPTEQQRLVIDNIIKSNWWTALPTLVKSSIVIAILTGGGALTTGQLFLDLINGLLSLSNEGIQNQLLSRLENELKEKEGIITTLTPKNVENWFSETYPASYIDSDNFKNNFSVSINNTKTKAVIETNDGSQEWEVSISGDNKIQEIK